MKRDTLLVISTSYPEAGDGSEAAGAFVADVARGLAERVPVRVLAPGRRAGAIEVDGPLSVHRFASPGLPLSLLSMRRPACWPVILQTLRSLRAEVLATNADRRIAHTLALWALPSGWAAGVLERRHAVPYSIWALGSDIWSLGRMPIARLILHRVMRRSTHRYADGLQLARDAEDIGGMPFDFLPSTRRLDGTRIRGLSSQPPYRLLFLGRWHPNKGIDLLLDALAALDEAAWHGIAELRIAGGGPLEGLVRQSVAKLQAAGRPVRLDGFLDTASATSAIAEADWLLIPSRIESIPVVFSDALNLGRPVIVTPVGDLTELVTTVPACGIVADSVSAAGIQAAIEKALRQPPGDFEPGITRAARMFDLDEVVARIATATMPHASRNRDT